MPTHAGFIAAAYVLTGLVIAGMILGVLLDHRAQNRALAKLTDHLERQRGPYPAATRAPRSDDEP